MSRIDNILAKLELTDVNRAILREELGGLTDAGLEIFEEGIRTRSRAKVGPMVEKALAEIFESSPWTTIVEVAEHAGLKLPVARGAFSGLVADGKVAIFKKVRRDGNRLVFPAGTTLQNAKRLNREDESNLRPIWRDVLNAVRRIEDDGELPFTADIAEELGLSKQKVMSTCAVLNQYHWLKSSETKVNGVTVIWTGDRDIDEIKDEAAIRNERIKRAKKLAKEA